MARAWRPQHFSEVIGQKHVTQTLQNAIRLNRIGHGYIFSGQRGVGKTTVARLLAKAVNCRQGPASEPCGECDSCREIAASRSVDVIEIDAASNRGIDAVRELRENVRYAPARDRYKVFIIDEAHQITPEGFNALLKTLEEPPPHVIFLLATTEPHQFPETILSRCQHFALHALRFSEILTQLEKVCAAEKVEADAEALAALAATGEGSLRDALSRLDQAIAAFGSRLEGEPVRRFLGAAPSQLVDEVFRALREQNRAGMLEVVEKLTAEGYQLLHFCSQLVRTVRNLLVVRVAGPQPHLLECSTEESLKLATLAEHFPEETLMRFLEVLLRLYQELRYSMEPRFQMELGLLKLVDAERLVAIEDLLARMESEARSGMPSERASRPEASGAATTSPAADQETAPGRLSPFEQDRLRKKQNPDVSAQEGGSPRETRKTSSDLAPQAGATEFVPQAASSAPAVVISPPPPSAFPASQPLPEEAWAQAVLRRLEERSKPLLASLLSDVRRWEFDKAEVRIRLADPGIAQVLPDSDRQLLIQLLAEVLGRRVKVTLLDGGIHRGPQASPGDETPAQEQTAEAAAAAVESRVRNDPDVQEFERLFGKPVTGIRRWRE